MSEIGQNLKNIVLKGIDLIGSKASDLASNAKQKVDLLSLTGQKNDLLAEIGKKVLGMSREGMAFPDEIQSLIQEVLKIDEELDSINAARKAQESGPDQPAEPAPGNSNEDDLHKEEPAGEMKTEAEPSAEDGREVPVIEVEEDEEEEEKNDGEAECPLSSAINDLFENMPQVDKMMDKVNTSLDELGENLLKFSGEFGKQLDDFTDRMMGKDGDPKE